jgi:hypothetical protein
VFEGRYKNSRAAMITQTARFLRIVISIISTLPNFFGVDNRRGAHFLGRNIILRAKGHLSLFYLPQTGYSLFSVKILRLFHTIDSSKI